MATTSDYDKTEELEPCDDLMSEWEIDFIQSLQEQMGSGRCGRCLSANQKNKLNDIYERVVINHLGYNEV